MVRLVSGRRLLCLAAALVAGLVLAVPSDAQTSMIHGKVVDAKGQPIEGAKITIEYQEANRHHDLKTNKKGEFVQIGLVSGTYTVTAEKEGLGKQSASVQVKTGEPTEMTVQLVASSSGPDPVRLAGLKKTFEDGVALSQAGDFDGAIAKFDETAAAVPGCYDCYYNIGIAYALKKQFPDAETAYKKAIELKPDYAAAYNGLATVYNAQRKFEDAAAASAKAVEMAGAAAASGGGADALYNQGVIFWNNGKIPEAKKQFEEVIRLDPNHADAHYQLGMALLNEGKMAEAVTEFETSLTLAPSGTHAAQAKSLVAQLKK